MDVFEEYTLDGDSNYSDYYDNQESLENFGLCHKKHLRKFGKIFLPVFYFVVCILSVVTNVGMIVIFLKNSHLRRPLAELHIISDCSFSNTLDLAVQLTESFAFTHAFLHPFLYGLMNRGIWKCLKIRHRKDRSEFKTGTSSHAPCLENDVELTAVN
ncbi:atypical chemokine receptor 2-like [Denticeps clupeoides]|uniref:atypical chemokine receptor 2-like n=1 Tax=Denticeps clupeoides TaxID=299321 RepID=UPI0010A469D5|nr:atypical chemokine receptor 2-like [Denticeps clupeoides]